MSDITNSDELNEIKSTYDQAIASASKERIEYKSKLHEKPKQEIFEEEEEEVQLNNVDELTISEAALQRQNQSPFAPPNIGFYKHNDE